MDKIARTLSKHSGRSTSRNMLIEDSIDAYIEDALRIFAQKGIRLEEKSVDASEYNTIVLPAHEEGFRRVFLDENKWYYVRLKKDRIPYLKYVAIYVNAPLSQITHYAKIAKNGFVMDENKKKYVIHLEGQPIELENPIPLGNIPSQSTRAPKYTTLQKLLTAETYQDL